MSVLKKPEGSTRGKKRVGRGQGSGLGCTAGKGNNGQNARSGGGVRPGFEGGQMPLYRRIARRGFSNYPFKQEYIVINLDVIQDHFASGDSVNLETLKAKGVIKKSQNLVKVLGSGEIKKKVNLEFLAVSGSAKEKIVAAGGTVRGVPVEEDSNEQEARDGE